MHSRLAAVETKLGLPPGSSPIPASGEAGGSSAAVAAYDAYCAEKVAPFVQTSQKIGGKVEMLGKATEKAFAEVRAIMVMAGDTKKPSNTDFMANLNAAIAEVGKLRERDAFENHARAVGEGIGALTWVNPGNPTPGPFVLEMAEASTFYINKVRTEFKGKEGGEAHIEWCKQLDAMWKGLGAFVKAELPTGLTWNPKGKDATGAPAAAAAAAPAAASGGSAPVTAKAAGAAVNVFAELSKIDQSSGKTAGLRHVTKDMKASANKDAPPVEPKKAPAPSSKAVEKPKHQVFALQGNKWVVEGQTSVVEIKEADIKQTVYIYNCVNATVVVNGKVNTITVDGCKNTQVVFQDVLALCELVNSRQCKVQCKGKAPTMAIDKCDGVVLYLSKETMLETKIVASKSSEMNVAVPDATGETFVERVIPEQYVHHITADLKVTAEVSDLYTHG